jgi:hypothetical protein
MGGWNGGGRFFYGFSFGLLEKFYGRATWSRNFIFNCVALSQTIPRQAMPNTELPSKK